MCSLHPRTVKKLKDVFEEIQASIAQEINDDAVFRIKSCRMKAIDELSTFKNCPSSERYLKVLNRPVPPPNNLGLMKQFVDDIILEMRR